jgi:hypothetical protein
MSEQSARSSRQAVAGDGLVTDTAAGDSEQSPPEQAGADGGEFPNALENSPSDSEPTNEQVGVLDPRRGGGQPSGPYDHWLYHEGL